MHYLRHPTLTCWRHLCLRSWDEWDNRSKFYVISFSWYLTLQEVNCLLSWVKASLKPFTFSSWWWSPLLCWKSVLCHCLAVWCKESFSNIAFLLNHQYCSLTALGRVTGSVLNVCLEFLCILLFVCTYTLFPPGSGVSFHLLKTTTWISHVKLLLGVNECLNVYARCPVVNWHPGWVTTSVPRIGSWSTTALTRIKQLLKLSEWKNKY